MARAREGSPGRPWVIVLAGGEGERVKPFVERWLGRHRPKQYCTFVGTRSMFQHTLDRAAKVARPERIVIVAARGHEAEVRAQIGEPPVGRVLFQPRNCDTAAGIYLPLAYVRAVDPQATVVLFPSDHFIHPEHLFLWRVHQALEAVDALGDRMVLLGGKPDRLETDYGWIEPSGTLISDVAGRDVLAVRSFIEKPDVPRADEAMRHGALWNTLVLTARADTLWRLGRRCVPEVVGQFERLAAVIGQPSEAAVLEDLYREMPASNFSSRVLRSAPEHLAVIELAGVLWSDWGKPERIAETLRRIGRPPSFPLHCLDRPFAPRAGDGAQAGRGM